MIARIWRDRVPAGKADACHQYLLETGVTDYKSTEGNRGVHVLRNIQDDEAQFLLLTFWVP